MSFTITIAGHSNASHDDAVLGAVQAALDELEQVEGLTASVSGYSWSNGTPKIELTGSLPRPVKADDGG